MARIEFDSTYSNVVHCRRILRLGRKVSWIPRLPIPNSAKQSSEYRTVLYVTYLRNLFTIRNHYASIDSYRMKYVSILQRKYT